MPLPPQRLDPAYLLWEPLPDTAIRLGRLRAHAHASDEDSGVWYELTLVLAMAQRDGQPHAAPALYLAPRLRRAFDLETVTAKFDRWTGRGLGGRFTPLASHADSEGFAPPTIETVAERRWDPHLLSNILPLDLLDEEEPIRQGALRRILAREPWALLDSTNHLASLFPLLEGMDPVDAACAGTMAAHGKVWAPDEQEVRGRPATFSPPPPEIDLLLHFFGPRRGHADKARLLRFVAAACAPLLGDKAPVLQDQLWAQAKQWNDAARRWCVRNPEDKGLPADERPSPPPFLPALVVDEGVAVACSGPQPRTSARPLLRRWLCSGRAARFLWVCAAGEPKANLRLPLTSAGSWPAFLERQERHFLDVEVEVPDGDTRWVTGFEVDRAALLSRLAPGCRAVPR
jgi:hypothetical protein